MYRVREIGKRGDDNKRLSKDNKSRFEKRKKELQDKVLGVKTNTIKHI